MHTSNLLLTQVPFYILLFLALFNCGIHYPVMSLAYLHLLFLKHIYISILRVCNQDTPYILAYATVVSIALEHKLFYRKKKKQFKVTCNCNDQTLNPIRFSWHNTINQGHVMFNLYLPKAHPSRILFTMMKPSLKYQFLPMHAT